MNGVSIMNDDMSGRLRISRRVMLTGSALALGAVAAAMVVPQAAAQEKISQTDAQYQATPKGDQHCGGCVNFLPSKGCRFVQGEISPNGWCQLFAPPN